MTEIDYLADAVLPGLDRPLNDLDLGAARRQIFDLFVNYLIHNVKLQFSDRLNKSQLMILWDDQIVNWWLLVPEALQLQK